MQRNRAILKGVAGPLYRSPSRSSDARLPELLEADEVGTFTEALSAAVNAVLADETGLVEADAAVVRESR